MLFQSHKNSTKKKHTYLFSIYESNEEEKELLTDAAS